MQGRTDNDGLPRDVMKLIFIKLSPRDLLISMGVCKSWRAMIRDSSLAYMHLKHSREAAPIPDQKARLVVECSDNLGFSSEPHYPVLGKSCEVMLDDIPYRVVTSCDGLVLLSTRVCGRELLLWNPAIRKIKPVPACGGDPVLDLTNVQGWRSLRIPFLVGIVGFGCIEYDTKYDYKIVQILCSYSEPGGPFLATFSGKNIFEQCYVMVYSLSRNCWRRIKATPPRDAGTPKEDVVFVNDSVHWIFVNDEITSTIVGFDLREERFWEVPTPEAPSEYGWNLIVCQGLLGAVMENFEFELPRVEIWVMKEHGVANSWCKQFLVGPMSFAEPVRCMKYEKVLLEQRFDEVFVCYSEDRHLRDIGHIDDLTIYLESLALLGDDQAIYKECKYAVRNKKKRPRVEG